jgi:hypothetical protein
MVWAFQCIAQRQLQADQVYLERLRRNQSDKLFNQVRLGMAKDVSEDAPVGFSIPQCLSKPVRSMSLNELETQSNGRECRWHRRHCARSCKAFPICPEQEGRRMLHIQRMNSVDCPLRRFFLQPPA